MRLLVSLSLLLAAALGGLCGTGRAPLVLFQERTPKLKLKRQNPHGWFTLLVPTIMRPPATRADIDGGFYSTDEMEIDYEYWTYENTPNFLRDSAGNYRKGPMLDCGETARHTRTWRTRIDGKRAIVQECSQLESQDEVRDIYYVTIPRLKVSNGHEMRNGMFNMTIKCKAERHREVARRIIRSLDF